MSQEPTVTPKKVQFPRHSLTVGVSEKKEGQEAVCRCVFVLWTMMDVHMSFHFAAILYKIYFQFRLLQPKYEATALIRWCAANMSLAFIIHRYTGAQRTV